MILIQLKQAMKAYKRKYDEKMTYQTLAAATGIGIGTLRAIQNREDYNTTIDTLDKICRELKITPGEIMVFDPTKAQKVARKVGGGKKTKRSKIAGKGLKSAEKRKTRAKAKKKKNPKS